MMIPCCILAIENDNDKAYMEWLYLQYQRLMYSTIFKIMKDSWSTEDILNTTLVKLIDRVQKIRPFDHNHLVNYIIVSCRNTAYTELKRQSRYAALSFDELVNTDIGLANDTRIEEQLMYEDDLASLSKMWPLLDERDRYLLEAKYILEKDAEEIATDLDIKPKSVRMALTRARRSAYQIMKKDFVV